MPGTTHHNPLFIDTVATSVATVFAFLFSLFGETFDMIDENKQTIIAWLTIITLCLLAVRHIIAIVKGRA